MTTVPPPRRGLRAHRGRRARTRPPRAIPAGGDDVLRPQHDPVPAGPGRRGPRRRPASPPVTRRWRSPPSAPSTDITRRTTCVAGSPTPGRRSGWRTCSSSRRTRSWCRASTRSWAPTTTNGDGFGVGWYGDRETPGCVPQHRAGLERPQPARALAPTSRSRRVFAHIRASTGSAVQQTNCHPFRHGRWLWMHNGVHRRVPGGEAGPGHGGRPALFPRSRDRRTRRCCSSSP